MAVSNNKVVVCPECENEIKLEERVYEVGDVIECTMCGTELEVVAVMENGEVEVEVIEEEK
ncbi:MAG: hypothetical protein Fur003_6480 [Candidatus Dojkabacteria bacterium]